MRRRRKKKLFSWLLMAAGALLLLAGARELLDSYWGQRQAARDWAAPPRPQAAPHETRDLGPAVAELTIPRLDASWFVLEGTGQRTLRLGPGHMRGTAPPGAAGNCVIAGHRDTHFRVLKDVRQGDEIVVKTRGGNYTYRVTGIRVVPPGNTSALLPADHAVLNLITCYPFYYVGPAPKRFVVRAELAQAS